MSKFVAQNPGFETRVRQSFNRQAFMTFLGAEIVRVGPGIVDVELLHRDELCQQHGFFHGGVVATIADNAGGYAGFSLLKAEDSILTVEFKINLISPANGEKLISRGRVIKSGRTFSVCEMNVFSCTGANEVICATALGTFLTMKNTKDDLISKRALETSDDS